MKINPEALKRRREAMNMSQDDLADAATVAKKTIQLIETRRTGRSNARTVANLARALKVSPDDLARAPSDEDDEGLRVYGYRQVKTYIDGDTSLAFQAVEHLYGISVQTQIDMAPLFAALLAEGSLARRRHCLSEIGEASGRLMSLAGGHLSFAFAAHRVEEGEGREESSIRKRDVFGHHVSEDAFEFGYDPYKRNPFSDYLEEFAKSVGAEHVAFDPDGEDGVNRTGFPYFRIAEDLILKMTDGDPMALHALRRGHASIGAIPKDLRGEEAGKTRAAWLASRVPIDEHKAILAQQAEWAEFLNGPDSSSDEEKNGAP